MHVTVTFLPRRLADRLHRRAGVRLSTNGATNGSTNAPSRDIEAGRTSRSTRLQRLLGASRVTPYQLRRGWLW